MRASKSKAGGIDRRMKIGLKKLPELCTSVRGRLAEEEEVYKKKDKMEERRVARYYHRGCIFSAAAAVNSSGV